VGWVGGCGGLVVGFEVVFCVVGKFGFLVCDRWGGIGLCWGVRCGGVVAGGYLFVVERVCVQWFCGCGLVLGGVRFWVFVGG